MDLLQLFHSVEIIWCVWAVSLVALAGMTYGGLRRMSRPRLRRLLRREEGAGYTLSFVMIVPLYVLLMCMVFETSLMLVAKIGTIYSAYSGARSAIVWSSAATGAGAARTKVEQAAKKSFVPFASSTAGTGNITYRERQYILAYEDYDDDPVSRGYLKKKYRFAQQHLSVDYQPPASWDQDVTVRVRYNFPFTVSAIARLFSEKSADGKYYYVIESLATLQNEGPQNAAQTLGIPYGTID